MSVTADEEAQIRKAVEAIDDEEPVGVLKADVSALTRFWAADLTVNAPTNQVHRHAAAELLRADQAAHRPPVFGLRAAP